MFHVAARSLAAQGLSIFGDHADVMAVRQTGFALLSSASVQEAHDFALVAHAATLRSRVPFLHFFDGFRTSHEVNTMERLTDEDLRALVPEELVREHRFRALTPERPFIRGTAQNPDVYFQARETVNPYYARVGEIVQAAMDVLAERTGRAYRLVDYSGHPEATRVVVIMGSGGVTARETVKTLVGAGERVGVLQVRLYRPFPAAELVAALPPTVEAVAVLDRTKEPGSSGEPLFLDVLTSLSEAHARGDLTTMPRVIGGRYGLSSKEFTPGMVAGIFAELATASPRPRFTVGISDDVGGTSLSYDSGLDIENPATLRAVFYGIGSDGTVGANKNTVKILAEDPPVHAQAYFVYDSKKSGGLTVSHLRFGPHPIAAPWLVAKAGFVGIHDFTLLDKVDVLSTAQDGATLLLNAPQPPEQVWDSLPAPVQHADSRAPVARCSRSTPMPSPARRGCPVGRTPSCRPVSSLSPACCRATRRWSGSRPRSARPTAGAAGRWCGATRRRSTARWQRWRRSRSRLLLGPGTPCPRSCRTTPRSSSAR